MHRNKYEIKRCRNGNIIYGYISRYDMSNDMKINFIYGRRILKKKKILI